MKNGYSGRNIHLSTEDKASIEEKSIVRESGGMASRANRSSFPDPNLVGQRLEAARVALGLEKAEFADSVGIDRSSYSKIIRGTKALNVEMAYSIAERWGVTMEYLYRGRLTDLPEHLATKLRKS